MEYTNLGSTSLIVSRICLGCMSYGVPDRGTHPWSLPEDESRPFIKQALDAGINFFDTANIYSDGTSEEIVGKLLLEMGKREDVVIATKVHPGHKGGKLSRQGIMDAIDGSLKRLGTDYVDLYQIHRWDYKTPIEETMKALHDIVKAGKVRFIGASSMYAYQFAKTLYLADHHNWTRFSTMQNYLNLLYREEEREMIPLCKEEGVALIPWSPLARGRLTRDWDVETERTKNDSFGTSLYADSIDADKKVADKVKEIAETRGVPRAQIALAWILQKETVAAPIIGATKPHHIDDAVASLSVQLTAEEIDSLESLYVPHSVQGFK